MEKEIWTLYFIHILFALNYILLKQIQIKQKKQNLKQNLSVSPGIFLCVLNGNLPTALYNDEE